MKYLGKEIFRWFYLFFEWWPGLRSLQEEEQGVLLSKITQHLLTEETTRVVHGTWCSKATPTARGPDVMARWKLSVVFPRLFPAIKGCAKKPSLVPHQGRFPAIKGCAKKPSLVPQLSLKKSKYQYRKESRTNFVWWLRGAVLKRPSALVFGGCDQQSITEKTRQKAFCRVRLNWSAISFDRNEVLKTPYSSDKVVPPQNIAAGKFSSCELYTVMLSIGFNNKRHVKRRMINSWYENGASYFLDDISHRITVTHERK